MPRTIDSSPTTRAAPNRLLGWHYVFYLLRRGSNGLYLVLWVDRFSRKVLGWDVRKTMPENLVSEVLRRALVVCRPPAWLIVHFDQGSQYMDTRFKHLLARYGALQSTSRLG